MPDAFDLLELPRRPWLDPHDVRRAFQERARSLHPDSATGDAEQFAALNAAQQTLADPAARLRLLAGDAPVPATPPDAELGFRIGTALQNADTALTKHARATHPLARALVVTEIARARSAIDALLMAVVAHQRDLEKSLKALDERWPDVTPGEIATLAGAATFLARWRRQLEESRLALDIASPMPTR